MLRRHPVLIPVAIALAVVLLVRVLLDILVQDLSLWAQALIGAASGATIGLVIERRVRALGSSDSDRG